MSKNPFRVALISFIALGILLVVSLIGFIFIAAGIAMVEENGPHFLWQLPLALLALFGICVGTVWVCEKIALAWKKAERNWDRRKL